MIRNLLGLLKLFLLSVTAILHSGCAAPDSKKANVVANRPGEYQCVPCGYDCDNDSYDGPGKCTHCQMELVKKSSITFKTIRPEAICDHIQATPGIVLLDVRTKEEFEGRGEPDFGSLKNAINIPIQEFDVRLSSIDSLRDKEIIVYCSHSHRSPRAAYILTQHGFTNVTNMAGGMSELKEGPCKK